MKKIFAKNTIALSVAGVTVISVLGAIWYVAVNHAPSFTGSSATRGNVVASLNEPVTVLAENNASLAFQASGQIAHVYVKEGDTVGAGTVLADLSKATLSASLEQANAVLAAAQAKLDELQSGTRPEQLTIDQAAVTSAQTSLNVDVSNAYTSADDAIHNQTDNLFTSPNNNNPIFLISLNDSQTVNNIESSRVTIGTALGKWYAAISASGADRSSLASTANSILNQIQAYLDQLALAANSATPNSTVTTSVLAGYKVNVSTARTEIGAAITTLTNAASALQTAQNALTLAQAGSTPQDIEAQKASVAQAQAAAVGAQVALNNASIVAPFQGTVQNVTAQLGQIVTPGVPVLSLVNNDGLKIQAYVSEADVAKLKVGSAAQITLDAFGTGTVFPATVTAIGNTKTQTNGSPAYLVTFHFANSQSEIKDGMTGNAHITLAEHDNVITVPSRLVINSDNTYFVLVQTSSGIEKRPVQIGLVGSDTTEITSGINEGDQLANF